MTFLHIKSRITR